MNAQKLTNSILQYAIQGKLIEQCNTDRNVDKVIESIKEAKALLIKDKVIKEEKTLNPITNEEIPFDIPSNWKWVRLNDLAKISSGSTPLKSEKLYYGNGKTPWITSSATGNLYINSTETFISEKAVSDYNLILHQPGTLILAMYGQGKTRGQVSELQISATTNQACAAISCYLPELIPYVKLFLRKIYFDIRRLSAGGAQPNLNQQKIKNYCIPLPPLEEQQRIVNKFQIIEEMINNYGELYSQKERNHNEFLGTLEKSILQYAMKGELVLQDDKDEPASLLLNKIKKKKETLVEKKVIKKEKEVVPITNKEIPYEIPDTWKWVRLREVGLIFSGGTPKTVIPDYWDDEGLFWITPSDMGKSKEKHIVSSLRKISQEGLKTSSAQLIPGNSIVYSSRAPIGHINIVEEPYSTNQGCKSIHPFKDYTNIDFLYYALKFMTPWIQKKASGTTFKEISGTVFGESIIPLPPIEEQKRVVSKIEELLKVAKLLQEEN